MAYHPFRNLGLKTLALGLAVLLWMTVSGEQIVERTVRVPLELQNIPAGMEIIGSPPATVDVRVRGASGTLGRLAPGEVVAVLDLGSTRPGTRLFHLSPEQVRAPFRVDVTQVGPATITLEVERTGSRVVPVVPAVDGEPAPGFVVGRVTAAPSVVEVVGPESRLNELTAATTDVVSIDHARATVIDEVTIGVVDSTLRLREPRQAIVQVNVTPAPLERTLNDVAVRISGGEASGVVLTPPRVAVSVRGPRAQIGTLEAASISATVDLASLGPGRYTLPVKVELPEGLGLGGVEPSVVEVRIR